MNTQLIPPRDGLAPTRVQNPGVLSTLKRSLTTRKSLPALPTHSVAFPSQSSDSLRPLPPLPQKYQSATPAPTPAPTSPSKRTMSNPPPPSLLVSLTPQPPHHAVSNLTAAAPTPSSASTPLSSPSRNSSVPSLFHGPRSFGFPSRSHSTSHSRPSLSSPSPPTPIVPSIPLKYATQHSQSSGSIIPQVTAPITPNSAPTPYSRVSVDQPASSNKQLAEIALLATASDPNLPSSRTRTLSESNHWSLTLKQLLAKPAIPVTSTSAGERKSTKLASSPYLPISRHRRSLTTDPTQFTIESTTAIHNVSKPRSLWPDSAESVHRFNDKNGEGSRHRRVLDDEAHKSGRARRVREKEGFEEIREGMSNETKERDVSKGKAGVIEQGKEPRTRNVLKRRPSASSKAVGSRNVPSIETPNLSRTLSASSVLKRVGFRNPLGFSSKRSLPKALSFTQLRLSESSSTIVSNPNDGDRHLSRVALDTTLQQIEPNSVSPSSHTNKADCRNNAASPTIISPPRSDPQTSKLHADQYRLRDNANSLTSVTVNTPIPGQFMHGSTPSPTHSTPTNLPSTTRQDVSPAESRDTLLHPGSRVGVRLERSATTDGNGLGSGHTGWKSEQLSFHKNKLKGVTEKILVNYRKAVTHDNTADMPSVDSRRPTPSEFGTPSPSPHPRSSMDPLFPSYRSPSRTPYSDGYSRNTLRKSRHLSSDGIETHAPYYTVFGAPGDGIITVGGPRDSFGASYAYGQPLWGTRTTIKATGEDKGKVSLGRSLSRKLSGKFRSGRASEDVEGSSASKGARARRQGGDNTSNSSKEHTEKVDDLCLPYLYSQKKHAGSETNGDTKERSGGLFKRWRSIGKLRSKEGAEQVNMDPPPIPKHYRLLSSSQPNDVYSRERGLHTPRGSKNTSHSPSSYTPVTPISTPGRPSTTTRSSSPMSSDVNSPRFWNRTQSTRSSMSSYNDVPPVPNPRYILSKTVSIDDVTSRSFKSGTSSRKPDNTISPKSKSIDPKIADEPFRQTNPEERSESPPIPLFSTTDVINTFPTRWSTDHSKRSSTPPGPGTAISIPPPTDPAPRRNNQRPKVHSRTYSFGDEALYPPVMTESLANIPKLTFRQMATERRIALTEQEKADRWNALLKKSDDAGGTLHFGGNVDKLPSDELRFSRTLSELAQDEAEEQ